MDKEMDSLSANEVWDLKECRKTEVNGYIAG